VLVAPEGLLDPAGLGEGGGEMRAERERGVAERDRDAAPGRQPGRPQRVGDVAVDVEDVDRAAA
jgi:hypothetical protein